MFALSDQIVHNYGSRYPLPHRWIWLPLWVVSFGKQCNYWWPTVLTIPSQTPLQAENDVEFTLVFPSENQMLALCIWVFGLSTDHHILFFKPLFMFFSHVFVYILPMCSLPHLLCSEDIFPPSPLHGGSCSSPFDSAEDVTQLCWLDYGLHLGLAAGSLTVPFLILHLYLNSVQWKNFSSFLGLASNDTNWIVHLRQEQVRQEWWLGRQVSPT